MRQGQGGRFIDRKCRQIHTIAAYGDTPSPMEAHMRLLAVLLAILAGFYAGERHQRAPVKPGTVHAFDGGTGGPPPSFP
jgi:hypothetical protein